MVTSRNLAVIALLTMLSLLFCCEQEAAEQTDVSPKSPYDQTRGYAMGFTDFPYAPTSEAFEYAYERIENDADMAVMHFDDGIPWELAFEEAEYPENMRRDLSTKESLIPDGHRVYLAVTPIAFQRDDIADHKYGQPGPWRERLDDPDVVKAYTNHTEYMIEIFSPDYFAYAIEANLFYTHAPERWEEFVTLAKAIYAHVKENHPSLPTFITIQADFYHMDPEAQREAINELLPYTDYIAMSMYPFLIHKNPEAVPEDYMTSIAALAPGKPFAIAETAWPAETISSPYPNVIESSEEEQKSYVQRLLDEAESLDAVFVTWFFSRDYDQFWQSQMKENPQAPTIRIWKDTGLFDGQGHPRLALEVWHNRLFSQR